MAIDPNNIDAFLGRGDAYSSKGEYDLAIRDYNTILTINPKNTGALYSRGFAYYFKGKNYLAIRDFYTILKLDLEFAFSIDVPELIEDIEQKMR